MQELSVKAGALLSGVIASTDADWLSVGGKLVPKSYVKRVTGDPAFIWRSLYEYVAQKDDELSFPPDVLITLKKPDSGDGWATGEYDGHVGLFPASYAVPMNTPSEA